METTLDKRVWLQKRTTSNEIKCRRDMCYSSLFISPDPIILLSGIVHVLFTLSFLWNSTELHNFIYRYQNLQRTYGEYRKCGFLALWTLFEKHQNQFSNKHFRCRQVVQRYLFQFEESKKKSQIWYGYGSKCIKEWRSGDKVSQAWHQGCSSSNTNRWGNKNIELAKI